MFEAALTSFLGDRPFLLLQLQPEGSVVFGTLGSGWPGVYRWCKQAAARGGGHLSGDALLFGTYDLLLLHLDADVAAKGYADGRITTDQNDAALPCELACPPASATTNALRTVILSWCGEHTVPARTVICIPSKSTEAWVVTSLYPHDRVMRQRGECLPKPESRLGQQRTAVRIRKAQADYQARAPDITRSWPRIAMRAVFPEAFRFQQEVVAALP